VWWELVDNTDSKIRSFGVGRSSLGLLVTKHKSPCRLDQGFFFGSFECHSWKQAIKTTDHLGRNQRTARKKKPNQRRIRQRE